MENEKVVLENPSLIGMIMNPGEQFKRIKDNPRIWGALIMITILFVVGTVLMSLSIDASEILGEEFGPVDGESEAFFAVFAIIGSAIAALFIPVITILIGSVIYLIVAKLLKSDVTFKQLFSMNTYIMIIGALSFIVNGLFVSLVGGNSEIMFTSLAYFIHTDGMMTAILTNIEVFSIWSLILTALGLQIVANLSKTAAWTVTLLFFFIGIVFSMVGTALGMLVGV